MLPIVEVMDKMPLYGDVVSRTIVLSLLLAAAAFWRPVLGPLIVIVAAHFIPWFGPSLWAMNGSFEASVSDSMRHEDPEYFALARSIPLWYLAGIVVGCGGWLLRKRLVRRNDEKPTDVN